MPLQRLTGLEIEALRKEYAAILKTIARLEGILKSEKKLDDVIRREMTEIRDQYGDDRRTELIEDDSATLPVVENKPVAEDTAILRLRDGQLRRMSPRIWRSRARRMKWWKPFRPRRMRRCISSLTGATASCWM